MAKVEYLFDPFDLAGITKRGSKKDRSKVLDEVADYIEKAIKADLKDGVSPVTGETFEALSPDYAAKKKSAGKKPIPNLRFHGDLIDSIRIKKKGDNLLVTVLESQQGKADGHNNHTGLSKLPRRPFIPNEDDGETFKPEIQDGIKAIIKENS